MKVKTKNRNYQYSPIFRLSSVFILVLAAVGVVGAIALFMFGMAWVFMGAYQNEVVSDKHISWGIVMICLGGYLVLMNAFALTVNALAINRRTARWTLLISIVSILGIVPLVGGIIMLFTPMNVDSKSSSQGSNLKNNSSATKKTASSQQENVVVQKFATSEEDRELTASQLRNLKLKIDQHTATETEKEKFEILLADYREKYPKTGQ